MTSAQRAAIASRLARLGIRPSKRRGQSFLVDPAIPRAQVAWARVAVGDRILEVGSGLGALTGPLLEAGVHLTCVEVDRRLAGFTRKEFPRARVLRADVLALDPGDPAGDGTVFDHLVSNVPYSISSPLLAWLQAGTIPRATLMLQEEFAARLVAEPGTSTYGRLTVGIGLHFRVEEGEKVLGHAFEPRATVGSMVVRLIRREPPPELPAGFDEVLTRLFTQRRKQLRNVIKKAFDRDCPEEWAGARIGELAPAEIVRLIESLHHE